MRQANQVVENDLFQRLPKIITLPELEDVAMNIATYSYFKKIEDRERENMEAEGFRLQVMIDEAAQWQKSLLKLISHDRLLPTPVGSDAKDIAAKIRYYNRVLASTNTEVSYVEFVNNFNEENADEGYQDFDMTSLQSDIRLFLMTSPRVQWSIKQLREMKSALVDVLEAGEMETSIPGCYWLGFGEFGKVGIYDSAGKFVTLIDATSEDYGNTFINLGMRFLL